MPTSVEQLFARFVHGGDPKALGEVFDRTNTELLSLALHLCSNPNDAEDALQATFVTAIDKRAQWDAARPLLPWLCGILVRHCRKSHERRTRQPNVPLPELVGEIDSPLAASERRELIEHLRRHVLTLPDEQRQVVLLQIEHGLSPAQIAEVLAVPPGTVRMRLHRGIKTLRGLLPAGLVALFGALFGARLPSRGITAVRQEVVRHAAAVAPIVMAGGSLLMKKFLISAAVALVLLLGWAVRMPPSTARPIPVPSAPTLQSAGSPFTAPVIAEAPANERSAARAPATALPTAPIATLVVRIVHARSGAPLPNVPLQVVPLRSDADPRFDPLAAITSADGECTLLLHATGAFRIETIGGLREPVQLQLGETTRAELRVSEDQVAVGTLHGQVVHHDGTPAGGAEIVLSRGGGPETLVAGTADELGHFVLSTTTRWLLVGARLPGYAPSDLQGCWPDRELSLVLPSAGATLSGDVADANGQPVPLARVAIQVLAKEQHFDARGFVVETPRDRRCSCDGQGHFLAQDLPAGELSLWVHADGHAPLRCTVHAAAGVVTSVRCELAAGCEIRGQVVDGDGLSVVGAHVLLGGTYGELRTTDHDGRFGFRTAAATLQPLRVEGVDVVLLQTERDFATQPGEWRVVVERLPYFLLRFVDEHGAPLVGWTLVVRASAGHPFVTDAAGRCRVPTSAENLGPLGIAAPSSPRATLPCSWPAGLQPEVESTIVVPTSSQPNARIAGRICGPDGEPLAWSKVAVLRPDGRYLEWLEVDEGAFRTSALPAGDYLLEVHRQGCGATGARFPVVGLHGGEVRDVGALRMPAEGLLTMHVVRSDGSAARNASVYLFSDDHVEHSAPPADGQPHPWPCGHYEWRVMDDDSGWQRGSLDVRVGETTHVEVVLQPGVLRCLQFPVPTPVWGEPHRVDYVLRAPDGSVYDQDDFDPRDELPFRYWPPLHLGNWTLELRTDGGGLWVGTFAIESMQASLDPIRIAVQPSR